MFDFATESMIQEQLVSRGISGQRVIQAFREVDRRTFVPPYLHHRLYADENLPIGLGQTISAPFSVAWMLEAAAIKPDAKVLEIGTGSGYQTALLSVLARKVCTMEVLPELSARARRTLVDEMGRDNIDFRVGDGFQGWSEEAPFDAILVNAVVETPPFPLIGQLRGHACLVTVVPTEDGQELRAYKRDGSGQAQAQEAAATLSTRFTPMVGEVQEA